MADTPVLLRYRGWRGALADDGARATLLFVLAQAVLFAVAAVLPGYWRLLALAAFIGNFWFVTRSRAWPVARVALELMFGRRLFWGLYALSLCVFLLYFFGQYVMSWAQGQLGESEVRVGNMGRVNPKWLLDFLRNALKFNGSPEMFRNFFWYEANTVMIALALSGSILIGNDLRHGSLSFYLSKPMTTWHYLLGKGLAVAAFLNLFTTLPAVVLFVQYGLLESWEYFAAESHLLQGVIAYGMVLSAALTVVLLAMAVWLRRTVPLIMAWMTLFVFCQGVGSAMVDGLHFSARWRLVDLWNCTYVIGNQFLGVPPGSIRPSPQPPVAEAAMVLGGVCALCLTYLILRVRAVEIVN
jgi:hypothetical protein